MTVIKIRSALQPNISTPLLTRVLKDGVQYFIVISLASTANIIMLRVAPGILRTMLIFFYPVMVATLGSRLILSLRGSLLRPAYNDGVMTSELDTLVQPS